jgi:hypothetical protein
MTSPDPALRPWYAQPAFIASALLILIALLGLAGVGVHSLIETDPTPGPSQTSSTAATVAASPTDNQCGTDTDQKLPPTPPEVQWQALGPIEVPSAPAYGPCKTTQTTASEFAHTPRGALVASAQILARTSITDPIAVAVDTITKQIFPGQGKDKFLQNMKAMAGEKLEPSQAGHVAAYQMVSYASDTAVLKLALRGNSLPGQYIAYDIVMRWIDSDWQMVVPASGELTFDLVDQLPGYIMWGPQ